MHYIDKTVGQMAALIGKVAGSVVGSVVGSASSGANSQTMTIGLPRPEVERFWREPENLSAVLDGIADIRAVAPDRFEWALAPGSDDTIIWESAVVAEENSLRFVDATEADAVQVQLNFADAPREQGTEVTIRAKTPIPDLLAGAGMFAVLYRARALMQTGEIPTLESNPSARKRPATEEA